jgi:hypothetical protein
MHESGPQLHINDVSQRLGSWLRASVGKVDVAFVNHFPMNEPEDFAAVSGSRIEICLHSVHPETPDRAARNRDDAFLVHYQVRVTGRDALECQSTFSRIFFALHESSEYTVVPPSNPGDPSHRVWSNLPGLLHLTAKLVRERAVVDTEVVLYPLDVRLRPMDRLAGRVVTEDGTPVMHAEIAARTLAKTAVSDHRGRFVIPGAPATGSIPLVIRARSQSIDISVDIGEATEVVVVMPKEKDHA